MWWALAFDHNAIILEQFDGNLSPDEYQFNTFRAWLHVVDPPLKCMTSACAKQTSNTVGKFKIELNINQPLMRGIKQLLGKGEEKWMLRCKRRQNKGLMLNCIRALCNADIKVGFDIGKDVSIPTTYVRSAQNYIHHMKTGKYGICVRGFAVKSSRVVKSIYYECVPIIISDNYVPPLFEILNWKYFVVFISEKDIPNMKNMLLSISEEKYFEMQMRVNKVQEHFLWHVEPVKYDLFHMILHSIWYNRVFGKS